MSYLAEVALRDPALYFELVQFSGVAQMVITGSLPEG
jgi:hypothetical protein